MALKAILFDLDGVLVSAVEWHYHAFKEACRMIAGLDIKMNDHTEHLDGLSTRQKLDKLDILPILAEQVYSMKQELTVKYIEEKCKPTDRVELLTKLKEEYALGCVTNCIKATTFLMLEKAGLLGFFSCIVTNEDTPRPKPHADPYTIAMFQLKVKPLETLIIEDNKQGLESARKSGAQWLHLKHFEDIGDISERLNDNGGASSIS